MSVQTRPDTSIIYPVYNCAHWIEGPLTRVCEWILSREHSCELVVSDDGSTDETVATVERFFEQNAERFPFAKRVLRGSPNRGKGNSIRRAMLAAAGRYRIFTDADLAYSIEHAEQIRERMADGAQAAMASRMHQNTMYHISSWALRMLFVRHLISRSISLLVRLTFGLPWLDTQAGLKGFTDECVQTVFPHVRIDRFGFDIEILCLARRLGYRVDEIPFTYSYDTSPSTSGAIQEGLWLLWDMARLRWRLWFSPELKRLDAPGSGTSRGE